MTRRKAAIQVLPDNWVVEFATTINGRLVQPGTELTVWGIRGRLVFVKKVSNGEQEWIDARDKDGRFRSFRPERVRRVHRISKMRGMMK